MEDNTFLAPLSPIQRSTSAQRLDLFKSQESTIYNKISPYYQAGGGIGPDQPFIYTKLTDSSTAKNLTRYDSQALPIGSTVRDVSRIGKFMASGTGLLFIGKQLVLQNANAFNETRIYNPLSVVGAAAKTGTLGLTNRPTRFIRSNGGLVDFFVSALASTVGFETRDFTKEHIEGTAGSQQNSPLPTYEKGGRSGLIRLNTAKLATSRFDSIWAGATDNRTFSQKLGQALINTLKSYIPTTNPLGIFGGKATDTWQYRPEYKNNSSGIYYTFLNNGALLGYDTVAKNKIEFYNGTKANGEKNIRAVPKVNFHTYYPQEVNTVPRKDDQQKWYASKGKTENQLIDKTRGIIEKFNAMLSDSNLETTVGYNKNNASAERYVANESAGVTDKNNYKTIPSSKGAQPYYDFFSQKNITIENKGFAKSRSKTNNYGRDNYNALSILEEQQKTKLVAGYNSDQSEDVIFFYFQDLVNNKYIPFRATLTGISDQNSAEWESISYLGRADKLFVYKGFSRDVNFSFKVYANSIYELVPMWERVNYLIGLTRPSKYTDAATVTNQATLESAEFFGDDPQSYLTGKESSFIYPPMINFRIGDLYVDQPAVLIGVSTTIPDDATWETLRKNDYEYYYGNSEDKVIKERGISRQLPNIIDISVQLKLMEKQRAITSGYHFGPQEGWENKL